MEENKYAILVSSCDDYSDLWNPFFDLLVKYWPQNNKNIYLSTESSKYVYKDLKIKNLNSKNKKESWSQRIYNAVREIDSDQIVLILEDFFLYDKVDHNRFLKTINWLNENPDIVSFSFFPIAFDGEISPNFIDFELRPPTGKYKVSATLAVWNKIQLLKYLKDINKNAWEWEQKSNELSRTTYNKDNFYVLSGDAKLIFPYDFSKYGLFSGKWLKDTEKLFKKENISVDFQKRGFFEEYKKGLEKSMISVFSLESRLVPWTSFSNKHKNYFETKSEVNKNNEFSQTFYLTGVSKVIRWEPSIFHGFAISNLKINITNKKQKNIKVTLDDTFGNFIISKNKIIFNSPEPYLCVKIDECLTNITSITFTGKIIMPISEDKLKKSFLRSTNLDDYKNEELNSLINYQFFTIQDKTKHIRLKPKLYFDLNGTSKEISIRPFKKTGKFNYSYQLDSIDNFRWFPSNYPGFSIKKLKIIAISGSKKITLKENQFLNLPTEHNKTRVFLTTDPIVWKNTKQITIEKLIIKGELNSPIPKNVLKKKNKKGGIYEKS